MFSLTALGPAGETITEIDGKPILVFRRSDSDLALVDAAPAAATSDWRLSRFRSRKPDIKIGRAHV